MACALEALSARGHSEAIVLEGGIPVLASLVRNGCCDGGLRQTETVWVGTALNGERVTTSTFWWGAAQQAASALVTLAYRGHADDVVREGAIAPLIALLRVSADGDLRGKQPTPPFWDEYWREDFDEGWRRGYGSAAGALSALAALQARSSPRRLSLLVVCASCCLVMATATAMTTTRGWQKTPRRPRQPAAVSRRFRRILVSPPPLWRSSASLLLPYVALCLFKWKKECKPISYLE